MKVCSKCAQDKPLSEFSDKQSWCKDCFKVYDRNRYINTDRPTQARANAKLSVERNREFVRAFLRDKSCVDCGNSDIRVLQFDHRDRLTKSYNVANLASSSLSIKTIQKEIDKCDLRCANCHMIRTGEQFNWWRTLEQQSVA